MNYKMRWVKITTGSLIAILGCIMAVSYTKINVAQADVNIPQEQVSVTTFVSKQMPVSFNSVSATKIEGQKPVLKYSITNGTNDVFTNIQFVVFVVDKGGVIKGRTRLGCEEKFGSAPIFGNYNSAEI